MHSTINFKRVQDSRHQPNDGWFMQCLNIYCIKAYMVYICFFVSTYHIQSYILILLK
jgi:hypothetical protein